MSGCSSARCTDFVDGVHEYQGLVLFEAFMPVATEDCQGFRAFKATVAPCHSLLSVQIPVFYRAVRG